MKSLSISRKTFAAALAAVYGLTNAAFLHAAESNVWADRRKAAAPETAALSAATLDPAQVLKGLPDLKSTLSPSTMERLKADVPAAVLARNEALLKSIPADRAMIRKISLPSKFDARGPVVVFLQDVHNNDEAQGNLAKTVGALAASGRASMIGLEAAFGPMDFSRYHDFRDQDAVRMAADHLLKDHLISGPVHTAYTFSGTLPPYIGVDDPAHYAANVEAYRRAAPSMAESKYRAALLARELADEKVRGFNRDLLSFDSAVAAYHRGERPFGDYVEALAARGGSGAESQRFLQALAMEKTLDFKRVESERARLIEALTRKLDKAGMERLLSLSLAYRAGSLTHTDYYRALRDICRAHGADLSAYPAMDRYVQYVVLAGRVDAEKLLRETDASEKAAYARLARTPEEKALVARSRRGRLTAKLLDFSLTPDEWAEYVEAKAGSEAAAAGVVLSPFEDFYREADARNHAMTEKLMASLPAESRAEKDPKAAVIVAGGFHTAGMSRLLTARGATVIEVAPKLTRVDGSGSAYLSVFTQEQTPLERIFKGNKLFVADIPNKADKTGQAPLEMAMAADAGPKAGDVRQDYRALGGEGEIDGISSRNGRVQMTASTAQGRVRLVLKVAGGVITVFTMAFVASQRQVLTGAAMEGLSQAVYVAASLQGTLTILTAGLGVLLPYLTVGLVVAAVLHALYNKSPAELARMAGRVGQSLLLILALARCGGTSQLDVRNAGSERGVADLYKPPSEIGNYDSRHLTEGMNKRGVFSDPDAHEWDSRKKMILNTRLAQLEAYGEAGPVYYAGVVCLTLGRGAENWQDSVGVFSYNPLIDYSRISFFKYFPVQEVMEWHQVGKTEEMLRILDPYVRTAGGEKSVQVFHEGVQWVTRVADELEARPMPKGLRNVTNEQVQALEKFFQEKKDDQFGVLYRRLVLEQGALVYGRETLPERVPEDFLSFDLETFLRHFSRERLLDAIKSALDQTGATESHILLWSLAATTLQVETEKILQLSSEEKGSTTPAPEAPAPVPTPTAPVTPPAKGTTSTSAPATVSVTAPQVALVTAVLKGLDDSDLRRAVMIITAYTKGEKSPHLSGLLQKPAVVDPATVEQFLRSYDAAKFQDIFVYVADEIIGDRAEARRIWSPVQKAVDAALKSMPKTAPKPVPAGIMHVQSLPASLENAVASAAASMPGFLEVDGRLVSDPARGATPFQMSVAGKFRLSGKGVWLSLAAFGAMVLGTRRRNAALERLQAATDQLAAQRRRPQPAVLAAFMGLVLLLAQGCGAAAPLAHPVEAGRAVLTAPQATALVDLGGGFWQAGEYVFQASVDKAGKRVVQRLWDPRVKDRVEALLPVPAEGKTPKGVRVIYGGFYGDFKRSSNGPIDENVRARMKHAEGITPGSSLQEKVAWLKRQGFRPIVAGANVYVLPSAFGRENDLIVSIHENGLHAGLDESEIYPGQKGVQYLDMKDGSPRFRLGGATYRLNDYGFLTLDEWDSGREYDIPLTPHQTYVKLQRSGFTVGGVNSDADIARMRSLAGVTMGEIERRAHGKGSDHHEEHYPRAPVLGGGETFKGVLTAYNDRVLSRGFTHQDLARPLFAAINVAAQVDLVGMSDGDFIDFTYQGTLYRLKQDVYDHRHHESLLNDGSENDARDLEITNLTTGKTVRFNGYAAHMIHRYGFYRSVATGFETTPESIIDAFGLKPSRAPSPSEASVPAVQGAERSMLGVRQAIAAERFRALPQESRNRLAYGVLMMLNFNERSSSSRAGVSTFDPRKDYIGSLANGEPAWLADALAEHPYGWLNVPYGSDLEKSGLKASEAETVSWMAEASRAWIWDVWAVGDLEDHWVSPDVAAPAGFRPRSGGEVRVPAGSSLEEILKTDGWSYGASVYQKHYDFFVVDSEGKAKPFSPDQRGEKTLFNGDVTVRFLVNFGAARPAHQGPGAALQRGPGGTAVAEADAAVSLGLFGEAVQALPDPLASAVAAASASTPASVEEMGRLVVGLAPRPSRSLLAAAARWIVTGGAVLGFIGLLSSSAQAQQVRQVVQEQAQQTATAGDLTGWKIVLGAVAVLAAVLIATWPALLDRLARRLGKPSARVAGPALAGFLAAAAATMPAAAAGASVPGDVKGVTTDEAIRVLAPLAPSLDLKNFMAALPAGEKAGPALMAEVNSPLVRKSPIFLKGLGSALKGLGIAVRSKADADRLVARAAAESAPTASMLETAAGQTLMLAVVARSADDLEGLARQWQGQEGAKGFVRVLTNDSVTDEAVQAAFAGFKGLEITVDRPSADGRPLVPQAKERREVSKTALAVPVEAWLSSRKGLTPASAVLEVAHPEDVDMINDLAPGNVFSAWNAVWWGYDPASLLKQAWKVTQHVLDGLGAALLAEAVIKAMA